MSQDKLRKQIQRAFEDWWNKHKEIPTGTTVWKAFHAGAALAEQPQIGEAWRLLESLTPGGSEFAGNAKACAAYVLKKISNLQDIAKNAVKRAAPVFPAAIVPNGWITPLQAEPALSQPKLKLYLGPHRHKHCQGCWEEYCPGIEVLSQPSAAEPAPAAPKAFCEIHDLHEAGHCTCGPAGPTPASTATVGSYYQGSATGQPPQSAPASDVPFDAKTFVERGSVHSNPKLREMDFAQKAYKLGREQAANEAREIE